MIPKQLQNPEFRFCLLRKQSKIPFEKDWQNRGYLFDDEKLLNHLKQGGNYGVIGGYGNLIILDKDSDKLPIELETFCIETGRGGKHFYLISNYSTNHVFINEMGELRANNYQVVGSGSIHPNGNTYKVLKDLPIKKISSEELLTLIKPYLREENEIVAQEIKVERGDTSRSGLEYRKVLALLRKGKSRQEIYQEMNAYSKWIAAPEQYRTLTFEKAENLYLKEQEKKRDREKDKEILPKTLTEQELNEVKIKLGIIYEKLIQILRKYCDIKEEYYPLIALWTIGTYVHNEFTTYPYLFINAMKGSGKSRLIRLIAKLSYNGELLTSLTEAVMFRTTGTLCIDEFEGITRKGKEALRELLNASYKKGVKIKRMKKVKSMSGEEQVTEEFEPYRPIAMANIWGMEEVLGDRCISIILEKSNVVSITKLIEDFDTDFDIISVIEDFKGELCSLCNVVVACNMNKEWNNYIISKHITTSIHNNITTSNYININNFDTFFNKLDDSGIDGRNLELSMPLLIIANYLGDDVFDKNLTFLKEIMTEKKSDELTESKDVAFLDFISQENDEGFFVSITKLTHDFKSFLSEDEDFEDKWINTKWVGRALKRLNLISKKMRKTRGIEVILNIKHAQEKIKMFK